MNCYEWDKKLKIQTGGRDDSHADEYHYPYEPTPYSVLERLVESEYINRYSQIVDYGCGKGRVSFFLNYKIGCPVIGVEYDEKIYQQAQKNCSTYVRNKDIRFVCTDAAIFEVEQADTFYFFNPFSVEILRSVVGNIVDSYYANPRRMQLFFYYPNDEYLSYLMTEPMLTFLDEIDCQDLYEGENSRERILIFEIE